MTTLGGLLPGIPGSSCPSPATALGGIGVGPVCQLASGVVSSVAGSAVSSVAGFGVDSVLGALGSWVADGASWLLGQIGSVIGSSTQVDLGASWFTSHYQTMAALAGVVIVPLMILGIIQSIYRQSASMLLRSTIVNVPLAILLTVVAVQLVQLGLAVTDAMSSEVARGAGLDAGHFMTAVSSELSSGTADSTGTPTFILFVGALAVVVGAVMVWVELLIRAAAVYVAVLFLPLALASLAWPAIAHWTRRLVDTLVALILGKFVIVSVLSLAAGALAAGTSGAGSFTAVLGGAALLLLAALAPWALFRLLPFLEAGAVGHLEGLSHRGRQSAAAPARSLAHVAMQATAAGAMAGAATSALGGAAGSALGSASRRGTAGTTAGPGADGRVGGDGGGAAAGARPDQAASSAESTGVGTVASPAHDIPAWEVHPEATAAARQHYEDLDELATGPGALTPLPRETAARHHNALGRDQLGVRLVTTPIEGRLAAEPAPPRGDGDA